MTASGVREWKPTETRQRRDREAAQLSDVVDNALMAAQFTLPGEHMAERYLDGFRVPVKVWTSPTWPDEIVYVYALPWSRGWAIFATEYAGAGCYDWRSVKPIHKGLQHPLYCERGVTGAWNISSFDIAERVVKIVLVLDRLSKARQARHRKVNWHQLLAGYFPAFWMKPDNGEIE